MLKYLLRYQLWYLFLVNKFICIIPRIALWNDTFEGAYALTSSKLVNCFDVLWYVLDVYHLILRRPQQSAAAFQFSRVMLRLQNDIKFYYGMYASCMCDLLGNATWIYSNVLSVGIHYLCVCVKDVGNIVKDVGRHFTDSYTGGGIILLVCGTDICLVLANKPLEGAWGHTSPWNIWCCIWTGTLGLFLIASADIHLINHQSYL